MLGDKIKKIHIIDDITIRRIIINILQFSIIVAFEKLYRITEITDVWKFVIGFDIILNCSQYLMSRYKRIYLISIDYANETPWIKLFMISYISKGLFSLGGYYLINYINAENKIETIHYLVLSLIFFVPYCYIIDLFYIKYIKVLMNKESIKDMSLFRDIKNIRLYISHDEYNKVEVFIMGFDDAYVKQNIVNGNNDIILKNTEYNRSGVLRYLRETNKK